LNGYDPYCHAYLEVTGRVLVTLPELTFSEAVRPAPHSRSGDDYQELTIT
jgi:hypothetical protein